MSINLKSAESAFENMVHVGFIGLSHDQVGQAITNAFSHSVTLKSLENALLAHISSLNAVFSDLQSAVALGGSLGLPAGSEAAKVLGAANTALQAIDSVRSILGPLAGSMSMEAPVSTCALDGTEAPAGSVPSTPAP
jgi:hypothetical protein